MKASKAKRLTDRLLNIFNAYARLSAKWDPDEEDDYNDLVDSIMDEIASFED